MNTFSKFFLMILGIFIGIAGVFQLQQIAFELLSAPDDGLFFLGLFYLAIVIFIWGSAVYVIADYLIKLKNKKDSECTTCKCGAKKVSNKQKPNN
jgi:TRAP-type C4-dicarboxylate transport system permease small subunit